jgi:hypothetical protein
MTSAIGKGLMGAAYGFMQGKHQQWQQTQADLAQQVQSQRLMQAKLLEEQRLAAIAAAKDDKDHAQAKELKGLDVAAADKRFEATQAGLNARQDKSIAAADARAAKSGAGGAAYKPQILVPTSGEGPSIAWHPGEPVPEGYSVPNDPRFRAGREGNAKADPFTKVREEATKTVNKLSPAQIAKELEARSIMSTGAQKDKLALVEAMALEQNEMMGREPPKAARSAPAAKQQPGSSRANPIDAAASPTRPPSGTWVRLPSGAVVQVP